VEMKAGRNRKVHASLARAVVEVINQHKLRHRCVVIGFNLAGVARVKDLDDSIRTGALFGPRQRAVKPAKKIIEAALDCGADEILLHHLIATPRLLAHALEAKLVPVVWTVDDPKWIERSVRHRIRALVTNNPARMSTVA
jgi:glycerophosphoryl diester phosphodiesterase